MFSLEVSNISNKMIVDYDNRILACKDNFQDTSLKTLVEEQLDIVWVFL